MDQPRRTPQRSRLFRQTPPSTAPATAAGSQGDLPTLASVEQVGRGRHLQADGIARLRFRSMSLHHRLPRLLPHSLHRPLHRFIHERTGFSWGPWGYFGCRSCDREWLAEHPEDRDTYDEKTGQWVVRSG